MQNQMNDKPEKYEEKRIYTDMCLSLEYVQLYEKKEKGEAKTFHFRSEYGEIEHSYIKREIPIQLNGKTYYDITSAYGYGGPIIREANNPEKLFEQYNAAFAEECSKNQIVSAFYRFHVIESKEATEYFDGKLEFIGPNVVRDLSAPLDQNMHKSVRTSVRHAKSNGLSAEFHTSDEALSEFIRIYTETMKRNDASDYYYFNSSFFHELQQKLKGHYVFSQAILEGKVISSFLTLIGSKYGFGFLGGTSSEYLSYGTSTFLEYETMNWLKNNGLQYYIIGGGMKGEDNLFRFKKKFDKEGIYPFYVGKKIYDKNIYDQLLESRRQEVIISPDESFFPLYRTK
ncbi:GNAT family N-acetyltransferase [Alkalibacterium sp. 20]|uniref:GNAT family N-acetyltransferase n=1 Tax=Alkalibacterium sp. 20 TaxID=1798803 RepID=UPI0015A608FB|nr:GNAT family N-acetyltransferase [Alkalibacterium sp. 20]